MNSLKWALAITLIVLGIVGNYYYGEYSLLIRVLALILLAGMTILLVLQTDKGRQFWEFTQESRAELRKVVWPSRQETVQTTMMVLGVVAIVACILWGVDILLLKAVAWLTGYGAR